MSADSTEREVFEEIDPDPDAILAEFGVESPDDLLEADTTGAHDATTDDEIDVDDTTAAELFADLEAAETANEPVHDDGTRDDDLPFEFVGDADVDVRNDGDVIDATASELTALAATDPAADAVEAEFDGTDDTAASIESDAIDDAAGSVASDASSRTLTIRADTADGLELVGPEPTSRRLPDETFGDAR